MYVYTCDGSLFFFPSSFLVRRPILSFRKLFLFVALNIRLPTGHPSRRRSALHTAPPRPSPRYSAHQVIYSLSSRGRVGIGRYTRALGIKPAISTVPFDFLIYARPQKPRRRFITAVEIPPLCTSTARPAHTLARLYV